MPALLSQVQEALGLPAIPAAVPSPVNPAPEASTSKVSPLLSSAPPIITEQSDSDEDVQTLAIPFRSGNSDTYLPMLSVDESWSTDTEFRFVSYYLISSYPLEPLEGFDFFY